MVPKKKPRKILLIEPNYKNKYPPIGLMKLSTYHKMQGDKVEFFKGDLRDLGLQIKFPKCLKALRRIHNNIDWINKSDDIRNYLKTRKLFYLEKITKDLSPKIKLDVISELKKHANNLPVNNWDRIYIATLFTFYWEITIKTIEFAKLLIDDHSKIYIGGVMASLLKNEIKEATGIKPYNGLLDKPGVLDSDNDIIIDELLLDYSILDEIDYEYPTQSAYFTYMTKGCTRKCAFCSVPKLEPTYKSKIESYDKYEEIKKIFGEQRNLLLMDNNVLASPKFPEIIREIQSMGFTNDAKYSEPNQLEIAINNLKNRVNDRAYIRRSYKLIHSITNKLKGDAANEYKQHLEDYQLLSIETTTRSNLIKAYKKIGAAYEKHRRKSLVKRYVDFNQGTDARYVTEELMQLMSQIPIQPLRIAFDHVGIKKIYINAVELAAKYGIRNLSNYILYNFQDKPEDFYERLKINVDLGRRLNIAIFSFPMKFIPLFGEEAKHRKHIGQHWNRKFIRAIQSVLNATKGIVAPGYDFFKMAFGENLAEFMELLWMPEAYIINRNYFIENGLTNKWRSDFDALDEFEKIIAKEIIKDNDFSEAKINNTNNKVRRLLSHYSQIKGDKAVIDVEVKRLRAKFNRLIKRDMFVDLTLTHDFDSRKRNALSI